MDSTQENLIYHFVKYYKSLGIPTSNWKIILHGNNSTKILDDNNIKYEIVYDYYSELKKDAVNKFIENIEGWLVYADLDEFFNYGESLPSIIDKCEKNGIELIIGKFKERITQNLELKLLLKEENIFDTFNRDITKEIWDILPGNQNKSKIMLIKVSSKKRPKFKGSHSIENMDEFQSMEKTLIVEHFRWTSYSKSCMRKKASRYISLNKIQEIGQSYIILYPLIQDINGKYYLRL